MFLILRNDSVNIAIIRIEAILPLSVAAFSKAVDQRYGSQERPPCFATFCQMPRMLLLIIKQALAISSYHIWSDDI